MSRKSNILVLSLVLITSFLLLNTNSFAGATGMEIPTYVPIESNCCFPHGGGGKCEVFKEGKDGAYECCNEIDLNQGSLCIDPDTLDSSLYDTTIWGSEDPAGCDDGFCENTVCQIDPSCCMDDPRYEESRYIEGGWDPFCAFLANEFCEVCGGTPLIDLEKDSDGDPFQLYSFVDLRERESFVQVTNVDAVNPVTVHVQIFDVSNNCNENNFFDVYTPSDTHIYDLRNITTNDGNPSGVVLPDNAYGMVVVTVVTGVGGQTLDNSVLVGNFRIIDNSGYEYRTNMLGIRSLQTQNVTNNYFNYNIKGNVTLSDVVGIGVDQNVSGGEVTVSPLDTYAAFDIDIYNTNEVPFSCRDIIFACIDDNSPLVESLLEQVGVGSVASFEYGINNAIPHSKGGELLCPGNVISDGLVVLRPEDFAHENFVGYVGLNNGNGRGSMDSFWFDNFFTSQGLQINP